MHDSSQHNVPRPSAWHLAALWAGIVAGFWVLGFLYDVQRPSNLGPDTSESVAARAAMAAVGFAMILLLFACLRYTRRYVAKSPGV